MRSIAAFAALLLLPLAVPPALAGDEPEAVYAKFHRAAMSGNLDEMGKYGTAARRAELQGMSPARKEAAIKLVQFGMPRAFKVLDRKMQSGGRATLRVSGPSDLGPRGIETMYGTVTMVQERGLWKVDQVSWSNERPAGAAAAPDTAPGKAAQPKIVGGHGAPVVGTPMARPARTLGKAKPECVYKPVMTAADMEACR